MKIPQELPQFEKGKAIFIVTGKQTADFYLAHESRLKELAEFKIKNPKYSDREGFFMSSGGGRVFGWGAVREEDKKRIIKEFLGKLEKTGKDILNKQNPMKVYLFSPKHILPETKRLVKEIAPQKTEVRTFHGNYTRMHPLKLVKELHKRNERRIKNNRTPRIKEEARKILEKTKKR